MDDKGLLDLDKQGGTPPFEGGNLACLDEQAVRKLLIDHIRERENSDRPMKEFKVIEPGKNLSRWINFTVKARTKVGAAIAVADYKYDKNNDYWYWLMNSLDECEEPINTVEQIEDRINRYVVYHIENPEIDSIDYMFILEINESIDLTLTL